jgi:tRNA dimethylallyltransferase
MWRLGLVDEAQALIEEGLREGKTASRAIGYSQALGQLDGRLTEQEAQNETTMLTQRYARRQMSWFRRDERIHWLDYQDDSYLATATELTLDWLNEQSK